MANFFFWFFPFSSSSQARSAAGEEKETGLAREGEMREKVSVSHHFFSEKKELKRRQSTKKKETFRWSLATSPGRSVLLMALRMTTRVRIAAAWRPSSSAAASSLAARPRLMSTLTTTAALAADSTTSSASPPPPPPPSLSPRPLCWHRRRAAWGHHGSVAARAASITPSSSSSSSSLPSPFAGSWSSPFSSSSPSSTSPSACSPRLSAEETAAAARLARVAGLAYSSPSELPVLLKEAGYELVEDLGESFFSRAFVCDDVGRGEGGSESGSKRIKSRVIAFRGLAWAGTKKSDPIRLMQALAKVWPVDLVDKKTESSSSSSPSPLSPSLSPSPSPSSSPPPPPGPLLHAHAGVAELAAECARLVRRLVRETPPMTPITMTGHSLGGALALATAVLLSAEGEVGCGPEGDTASSSSCRRPVRVVTFGAPPSFAPASGDGDLNAALARLLGPGQSRGRDGEGDGKISSVTSFFAEGDPVPRWLLSSDPSFAVAASFPPLAAALAARAWLFGPSAPLSTGRFLFEPAGECYLVSWSPRSGHSVVPLPRGGAAASAALAAAAPDSAAAVASAAARAVGEARDSGGNVRRAIGFLLDHAHASYADDLKAAAKQARRGEK